jgi:hypothetical protein
MGFDVKRICLHADPVAGFRRLVSSHPEAPGVNSAIRLIAKPGKIARLTTRLGARQLNRRLHLTHQQKSCERRISTSPYCQKDVQRSLSVRKFPFLEVSPICKELMILLVKAELSKRNAFGVIRDPVGIRRRA